MEFIFEVFKIRKLSEYLSFICKYKAASKHCKWLQVMALYTKHKVVEK